MPKNTEEVQLSLDDRQKLQLVKELMAIYRKEIGHGWEGVFASTVVIVIKH